MWYHSVILLELLLLHLYCRCTNMKNQQTLIKWPLKQNTAQAGAYILCLELLFFLKCLVHKAWYGLHVAQSHSWCSRVKNGRQSSKTCNPGFPSNAFIQSGRRMCSPLIWKSHSNFISHIFFLLVELLGGTLCLLAGLVAGIRSQLLRGISKASTSQVFVRCQAAQPAVCLNYFWLD